MQHVFDKFSTKFLKIFFAIEVGAQRSTLDDIDAHVAHQRMT
jgi:hypothetical protein